METLELLALALGLATLAGINLYLTVFATSLAVKMGWVTLAPQYEQLSVLADPVILWVSGVLFFLEFFADKVPWIDSLWDSVHTLIRPVGAAFLAITALGEVNPVFDVLVGLLGGGMALTTHSLKAGSRLVANASPEPFSNIGLSLGEDFAVLGGLGLLALNPVLALVLALIVCVAAIWILPGLFRRAVASLWFLWRRVVYWFGGAGDAESGSNILPAQVDQALAAARGLDSQVRWFAPCVSGRVPGIPVSVAGWLLLTDHPETPWEFACERGGQVKVVSLGGPASRVTHTPGFLCDRVVIYKRDQSKRHVVQFDRSRRSQVKELIRMTPPAPASDAAIEAEPANPVTA